MLEATVLRQIRMTDVSLMDTVIMTLGVLITMSLLSCLCCFCMKLSDLRMKRYILKTADRKGIQVNIDKLDLKHVTQSPQASEICTVIIPDVGIVC